MHNALLTHTRTHAHTHTHTRVCVFVYAHRKIVLFKCTILDRMNVYMYTYIYLCVCVCEHPRHVARVFMYVCTHICVFMSQCSCSFCSNTLATRHTYRDSGEKMTELAARGLCAIRNTAAALTTRSRDLPSASWMGGHGKTTTIKSDDW